MTEEEQRRIFAKNLNYYIANSGKFSSDRTIEDYVKDIWHLKKVAVK